MYSQKKIQATMDAFAASEGWTLTPHTLDEVNEFKAYIDSIVTIHSNSKSSWLQDVKPISAKRQREVGRWIENEQALCAIDSGYFESKYAYITNEQGVVTKFQNRKSQEVLDSIIADLEERDLPIELLILGSRQNGINTKILLKALHRMLFVPYTQSLIASVTHEKSGYMGRFIETAYNDLSWWLIPIRNSKNSFDNGSRNITQSGSQKTGLAQGWTPTFIYLTDVESFPNPHKTIEEGLLRAVHSSRNTFMVLHGFKNDECGWLADTYRYAKEYYPKGKFRLMPVFIPWTMCSDIYPQPDWLRIYPIPVDWKPMRETLEHKEQAELFIRNTPYLAKVAGSDWNMSAEQKWYWESMYVEAKAKHTLEQFEKFFAPNDEIVSPKAVEVVDMDNIEQLFPNPTAMQEKIAAIRSTLNS